MARLQILELPSGINDERPPYLLVVDEVTEDEAERIVGSQDAFDGVVKKAGAKAAAVFHGMSVAIPANDPLPAPVADDPERAGTTQIVYAHERTRLDLCSALLLSSGTTWRKLIEHAAERQREVAGLYRAQDDHKAALLDALGMDRTRDWDDIRNAAAGLRKERDAQSEAIERVRRKPSKPEVMNAQQEHPTVWMHGYECGVLAAKGALRPRSEPTVKP